MTNFLVTCSMCKEKEKEETLNKLERKNLHAACVRWNYNYIKAMLVFSTSLKNNLKIG